MTGGEQRTRDACLARIAERTILAGLEAVVSPMVI
jgi:hypothetical protein